jgi:hypothetical protein
MTRIAKTVDQLVNNITSDLADNNAGLISAADVRENMADIAYSIPYIVASGDWESVGTRFISNVHLRTNTAGDAGGILIVESGVRFNNPVGGGGIQVQPYPGPTGIDHGQLLASSLNDDDHPQYVNRNGVRTMTGHLGVENNWIRASGATASLTGHGIQFEWVSTTSEIIHVGSNTIMEFDVDATTISTGRSTAQAWLSFSSVSGVGEVNTASVHSAYNISKIERLRDVDDNPVAGKFKIYFKPNLFANNDYVAVGRSTGRASSTGGGDFDRVTVGIAERTPQYLTFYVLQEDGDYVDSEYNDLLVFGNPSGSTPPAHNITIAYEAV